jgi:hypothetical protein
MKKMKKMKEMKRRKNIIVIAGLTRNPLRSINYFFLQISDK